MIVTLWRHTITHIFWTFQQIIQIIYLHSRHSCFVQTTIYPDNPIQAISVITKFVECVPYRIYCSFFPLLLYLSYNIKRTIFHKNVYKKYNRAIIITSFYKTPCVKRRL